MNTQSNFILNPQHSNKIRSNLILITDKDNKTSRNTQQPLMINSQLKQPICTSDFVIHLDQQIFHSSMNYNTKDIPARFVYKSDDKFCSQKFQQKEDNEDIINDVFYEDYQKINSKFRIAYKKNKTFKKYIPKESDDIETCESKKNSKTSDVIMNNLENINLTKGFLSNINIYKRVKKSFYYLRDICNKYKKIITKKQSTRSNNSNISLATSKDSNSEIFNQFEQIIITKENIDDDVAIKMARKRDSNFPNVFKRYKSNKDLNLCFKAFSPSSKKPKNKSFIFDNDISNLEISKSASPKKFATSLLFNFQNEKVEIDKIDKINNKPPINYKNFIKHTSSDISDKLLDNFIDYNISDENTKPKQNSNKNINKQANKINSKVKSGVSVNKLQNNTEKNSLKANSLSPAVVDYNMLLNYDDIIDDEYSGLCNNNMKTSSKNLIPIKFKTFNEDRGEYGKDLQFSEEDSGLNKSIDDIDQFD